MVVILYFVFGLYCAATFNIASSVSSGNACIFMLIRVLGKKELTIVREVGNCQILSGSIFSISSSANKSLLPECILLAGLLSWYTT